MWALRKSAGQPDKSKALDLWIGCTERAVATTMVIIAPAYVGGFILAWVGAKLAANWQRISPSRPFTRQGTLIALLGSVYSFSIAIGVGLWVQPRALDAWAVDKRCECPQGTR